MSYDIVAQVITSRQYYAPLLGLADSTRMGIFKYDVDHYSDYYELDRLPSTQASAVIQATKQHFGRHGVPHTLITDNGAQFTSEAFKTFAEKYKFHHIT